MDLFLGPDAPSSLNYIDSYPPLIILFCFSPSFFFFKDRLICIQGWTQAQ